MYNRGRSYGSEVSFVDNRVLSLLALAFIWQPERKGTRVAFLERRAADLKPNRLSDGSALKIRTPRSLVRERDSDFACIYTSSIHLRHLCFST